MLNAPTLARRALKAAVWGYAGAAGKLVIQLGSQIVLARLLGPTEYGLFAIGTLVVALANFFADAGIGAVLVQKSEIDDELIKFIGTWQLIAGVSVTAILWLLAPWIAQYFTEPQAVDIVRAMSLVCLLGAFASVPSNLLRRKLDFKPLQLAQLMGFFVGYVIVGIPCAIWGLGVWSLVLAWLCQATLTCIFVYRAAKPPKGLRITMPGGWGALKFGGNALVSNLSTWAGTSIDKVVVGRFFTTHDLGIYNAVNNLLSTAVTQVLSTLQAVLFSASSRVNADRDQLAKNYLLLVEVGALLFLPVFACVAAIPDVVLVGLYGPKWEAGASVLTPMALTMAAYGMSGLVTPLLWATGKVQVEGRIQLTGAVAIAITAWVAAQYGHMEYVAWAVFVCVFVRAGWSLVYAAKILNVSRPNLLKPILNGVVCSVLNATALFLFCKVLRENSEITVQSQFLVSIPFGAAVFLLFTVVIIRVLGTDAAKQILKKAPLSKYYAGI